MAKLYRELVREIEATIGAERGKLNWCRLRSTRFRMPQIRRPIFCSFATLGFSSVRIVMSVFDRKCVVRDATYTVAVSEHCATGRVDSHALSAMCVRATGRAERKGLSVADGRRARCISCSPDRSRTALDRHKRFVSLCKQVSAATAAAFAITKTCHGRRGGDVIQSPWNVHRSPPAAPASWSAQNACSVA
jgi:hypothetical protein